MIATEFILAWLLAVQGLTLQSNSYTVQPGDSLASIGNLYLIPVSDIIEANPSLDSESLSPGQTIYIPRNLVAAIQGMTSGTYTVRNGENDNTIARKLGLTVHQLHELNPGQDWSRIQIGQQLNVPSAGKWPLMTLASTPAPEPSERTYKVLSGDNDWVIARKLGIAPSALRAVNPSVDWAKLQIGTELVVPSGVSAAALKHSISTSFARVADDRVAVRRGPGTNTSRVTVVDSGRHVKVLDRSGEWYKVRFPGGTEGWIRGDLLAPLSSSKYFNGSSSRVASSSGSRRSRPSASKADSAPNRTLAAVDKSSIIGTARSLMGTRYRWGGTSRGGFDCSGFVSYVFKVHGVSLPRTSSSQAGAGQRVSRSELKSGDLVFFRTGRSGRISHVGIYIGGGQFIHSSSGRGQVTISSLNGGYYGSRYAGARRVVGGGGSSVEKAPEPKPAPPVKSAAEVVPKSQGAVTETDTVRKVESGKSGSEASGIEKSSAPPKSGGGLSDAIGK